MQRVVLFVKEHWGTLVAVATVVVATLINRLPKDKVPWWLEGIADLLAAASKPGMAGLVGPVSLPGMMSRPKETPPTAALHLLPLVCALSLLLGCTAAQKQTAKQLGLDVGACLAGQVPDTVLALVDQVEASLLGAPGAPSWNTFARGTLLSKGIDVAICSVEAALHDLDHKLPPTELADASNRLVPLCPDPALFIGHDRGVQWLSERHVQHQHRAHALGQ